MNESDDLVPLPDPTPENMSWMFRRGLIVGVVAVCLDAFVTQSLLGFENPYVVIALIFLSIPAITGAMRDNSLPMIFSFLGGILIGVLVMDAVLVFIFGQASVLFGGGAT